MAMPVVLRCVGCLYPLIAVSGPEPDMAAPRGASHGSSHIAAMANVRIMLSRDSYMHGFIDVLGSKHTGEGHTVLALPVPAWRVDGGLPMARSSLADVDDQHLAVAARAGSKQAWEELVRRHFPRLRRYLAGHLGDMELAAELTQDVLVAAGELLGRLPDGDLFIPWLYRIALNHLKRARRRQGRQRRPISLDSLLERSGSMAADLWDPSDVAEAVAEQDLVQRVLGELRPTLREALLLNALTGLSAAEVAQLLGLSLAAAERRISRAKEEFRQRYNALIEGDEEVRAEEHGRLGASNQKTTADGSSCASPAAAEPAGLAAPGEA